MAFEHIQYTNVPVSSSVGLLDLIIFFAGPGLVTYAISDDTTTAAVAAISGLLAVLVIKSIRRYFSARRSFITAKVHLAEQGINVDMEFAHQLAVDSVAGKIVFVTPVTMSYQIYERDDILSCAHQWVAKPNINGRPSRTQNVLVFQTRNARQPLYKIQMFTHAAGELWLARLNAVLNS